MERITPINRPQETRWHAVEKDGKLTCSCGRELVKKDELTYTCSGGYPNYRFKKGDIIKDKFGQMWLKKKH